jgi:hypothetical protein
VASENGAHKFLANRTASQDWLTSASAPDLPLDAACFESRPEHGSSRSFPQYLEVDGGRVPQAMTAYLQIRILPTETAVD